MITIKLKTLISLSTLLCAGLISTPAEARCRINVGFNLFAPAPVVPVAVPVAVPCRGVIIRDTCPIGRPVLATRIADRPSTYDRYYMYNHPNRMQRSNMAQQFECVDYPAPTPVDCLPSINSIYDGGELIQLNDGSLWLISDGGRSTARRWMLSDQILVTRCGDGPYPFILTNRNSNTAVYAAMKCGTNVPSNPAPTVQ
jgi:hypothetical protein